MLDELCAPGEIVNLARIECSSREVMKADAITATQGESCWIPLDAENRTISKHVEEPSGRKARAAPAVQNAPDGVSLNDPLPDIGHPRIEIASVIQHRPAEMGSADRADCGSSPAKEGPSAACTANGVKVAAIVT